MERTGPASRHRLSSSVDNALPDVKDKSAKKARFPKGKKATAGDNSARNLGVIDGEEDDGPIILSADPRVAAKERALKRDFTTEQIHVEDTGVLADVTKAEEVYEEEDEEIVEDGQRFEPFNLKQEREDGYFDAQGNYVEYRNEDDEKDAWLETVEVDTRFAAKALAESEKNAEDEGDNLGKEELWAIKQRMANALRPGETVLGALRRLKGTPKEGNKREKMSEANQAIFDQLTDDAVKLLDDGDYNVYEETRETFQREAEGYAALARLRAGITNGNGAESSQAGAESDMFGDEDESAQQVGPSNHSSGIAAAPVGKVNGKEKDMFGDDDEETPSVGVSDSGNAAAQVWAPASEATTTTANWATTMMQTQDCTAVHLQVYGTDLTKSRTCTWMLRSDEARPAVAWRRRGRLATVSEVSVY